GTGSGTELLKDIEPGATNSNPGGFIVGGGKAYFTGGLHGLGAQNLWVTDGTPSGTQVAAAVNPSGGSNAGAFGVVGSTLFFGADDRLHGNELWELPL